MPRSSAKAPPAPRRWWVRLLLRLYGPRTLLVAAVSVAALVILPAVWHLVPNLQDDPLYRSELGELRITEPHRWIPVTFLQDVYSAAGLPAELPLLDDDLVRSLAGAFEEHPWVERVVRVEKSLAEGVCVELAYRRPALMVETVEGTYPVDGEAVLLPPADFSAPDVEAFPRLRKVTSLPQESAGFRWRDPLVVAGAGLAELLLRDDGRGIPWQRFGLKAIEPEEGRSGDGPEDIVLELVTNDGSRIIWGRAPGRSELEPTAEQKIARLQTFFDSRSSLDSPGGTYRIDIRHWDVISLEPLEREAVLQ